MPSAQLTRAPSLGDQLANALRDRIIRQTIQPGTHLVEDSLTAEYDVSRGPVRDALRILKAEGLVESRRRGFYAVGLTESDLFDLYEMREAIEMAAMTRLIGCVTDAQLAEARVLIDEMLQWADRQVADEFKAADLCFHALLVKAGGNRRLFDVWHSYEPVFSALMQLTIEKDADLHPSALAHTHLLDLIAAGDTTALRAALKDHLNKAQARITHVIRTVVDPPEEE